MPLRLKFTNYYQFMAEVPIVKLWSFGESLSQNVTESMTCG
jgi:hypothetical protein